MCVLCNNNGLKTVLLSFEAFQAHFLCTVIAVTTSSSAMAKRPRELGDFKVVVGHFEAKFPFWAEQEVLCNYKANITGNRDITLQQSIQLFKYIIMMWVQRLYLCPYCCCCCYYYYYYYTLSGSVHASHKHGATPTIKSHKLMHFHSTNYVKVLLIILS